MPSTPPLHHTASVSSLPSPPYTPEKPPAVSPVTGLAFWNTHLPPHLHTEDCPSFLRYAFQDHRDRACLAAYDRDYTRTSWEGVRQLVRDNALDGFRRVPSELRRYREFTEKLVRDHGSIMRFIIAHRLHWLDLTPSASPPFADPADYRILRNDWPYGIDPRIVHLVVWTKFELTPEPVTPRNPRGDLTPAMRSQIQRFVDATFAERCGRENVLWFKNWSALKSVHAVEHFHVMVFQPDTAFIDEITGGDVPLADQVGGPGETGTVEDVVGGGV